MKYNTKISSSRRKCRKAHFNANDAKRRMIMSAGLSKELRSEYIFKSFPVVKGDEVLVLKGDLKGKTGKIVKVNRATFKVVLDISYREKKNGQTASFGIYPSSLVITKFALDKNRDALLQKKKEARIAGDALKKERQE
ncbi:large subunit ribosomal protein L26e [Nematocida ausubeli]|nr:uncharacterized protein NESG_01199 [Nematocida ausubeli]KAI5135387.1 large subunit ribosomal protein L26e [Nematocida ausubeli]KAI5136111.1 large subunit ribosomal protein L26e [Nematocida ausubeli]KAI5148200.1 large subunit ribosomal protein L26e [Nematocida ausubeli]KAI5163405.1 large subunit ribosomal protein L26e [Nematocida ausubeli]KFG26084.1 hypothetical protein NESG_01199 [Nematocida ausubeli]